MNECERGIAALEDALYAIGGKWKLRIVSALKDSGARRFNELQRTVKGISPRVLSNELKELEMNGFVKRIVHAQSPVLVEYELTPYSDTLKDVLVALIQWGANHRVRVREGAHSAV
ncbi:helix-turn-helix domain-containing protein [Chitinophaga sp. SYP-B3965]|uniref:winged helix-turn-helix transcriptional regulator n=1 Tax=Chitinophaga sp. SYP-B3965 TaxID=2663120 RepID=UPI0020A61E67|nr:helix-turn-helix domain-containing protein [Chitinophaga sp. SYP-B3965]